MYKFIEFKNIPLTANKSGSRYIFPSWQILQILPINNNKISIDYLPFTVNGGTIYHGHLSIEYGGTRTLNEMDQIIGNLIDVLKTNYLDNGPNVIEFDPDPNGWGITDFDFSWV